MNNKKEQRIKAKQLRLDINKELYQAYSDNICKKLMELDEYVNANTVLAYCPISNEVDTSLILEDCIKNKVLALPRTIIAENKIIPSAVNNMSDLHEKAYSIMEPKENCSEVNLYDINLIVVPLVAFDKYGTRLGYGGGYYDRLLSKTQNCKKVGIAFSLQELNYIKSEAHDIKLDVIITEKKVFNF